MPARFVLGLNQYTHSAAAALLDDRGRIVHALAKERVTRKKHDGGDTSAVVEALLEQAGVGVDQLELVVANCHLFRIRPFERDLAWSTALHQVPPTYLSPANLLPGVPKHELSHHLAHAWSVLPELSAERGLIVVADGIGSTWADVQRRSSGSELGPYTSDADLPCSAEFVEVPANLPGDGTWREAESVYRFDGLRLERLFKRWTREHTPVGAVYSRVASHVFGDWNVCGKVMGLAPWSGEWAADAPPRSILSGSLESLAIDWERLRAEPGPNAWAAGEHRSSHTRLCADVQRDLEDVLLEFLTRLQRTTGATCVALVGGVALNSTANGRIAREAGFEHVVVPPWPGDDGVALGCAHFGHHLLRPDARPPRAPTSPYLGSSASRAQLDEALDEVAPWIEWSECDGAGCAPDPAAIDPAWLGSARGRIECAADALARGEVVGWFQGRSEFGPRALGHRSILATPADAGMVERINAAIKKREAFRPFAPTVLAERAEEFFEDVTPSPWMSLTVRTKPEARARIPAVVHVDGTARLQTLARDDEPLFRALIDAFAQRTGLPLVLNTSLNMRGQPLAESATDALALFLDSALDLLVLEDRAVRRRPFPERSEHATALPRPHPGYSAEVVTNADGDAVSVALMAHGDNWTSDALELTVLEACTGEISLSDLVAELGAELEATQDELLEVLRTLHARRLVSFDGGS